MAKKVEDYANLITDRSGDEESWNWRPAVEKGLDAVKHPSRGLVLSDGQTMLYRRNERLEFPAHIVKVGTGFSLTHLQGMELEGEGEETTILEFSGAGPLWNVRHSRNLHWKDMQWRGDFSENSGGLSASGFLSDPLHKPTFCLNLENVRISDVHFALNLWGDAHTDTVTASNLHIRDCLYAVYSQSEQSVLNSFKDFKFHQFADFPLEYATKMAGWSSPKTLYSGAAFLIRRGGSIEVLNADIIGPSSGIVFEYDPTFYQTAPIAFRGGRWECRWKDAARDGHGQERSALARSTAGPNTGTMLRSLVKFDATTFNANYGHASQDLFYLYNGMDLVFSDCTLNAHYADTRRLVGQTNGSTGSVPGKAVYRNSPSLSYEKRGSSASDHRRVVCD